MLGQLVLHLSQVLTFHRRARPRLPGCTSLKRLYEITLKTRNTEAIHLPRRGKFILGSEHIFASFYWQNTLQYEPPGPHTKVRSVLVSEGWAKAVGQGVREGMGGDYA